MMEQWWDAGLQYESVCEGRTYGPWEGERNELIGPTSHHLVPLALACPRSTKLTTAPPCFHHPFSPRSRPTTNPSTLLPLRTLPPLRPPSSRSSSR